jgi:aryl-alcohol dehydrogenase-like predicted oxidoreductase
MRDSVTAANRAFGRGHLGQKLAGEALDFLTFYYPLYTAMGSRIEKAVNISGHLTMKYVRLGSTGLVASVLGFGCSAIGGRVGRKRSLKALAAAFDLGITYYDAARSYGYGEAEGVLGEFICERRDKVIIATKFGIVARRSLASHAVVKRLARGVFSVLPTVRRKLKTQLGSQFVRNLFSPREMTASLDESLRQLRTDYIDVFLLHACTQEELTNHQLFSALEDMVRAGKVRHLGITSGVDVIPSALQQRGDTLSVLQFPFSLSSLLLPDLAGEPKWRHTGKIAYQPFDGDQDAHKIRECVQQLARNPDLEPDLRAKLREPGGAAIADLALNGVLRNTGVHVALCSMSSRQHLLENVQAIENSRFSQEELERLQRSLRNRFIASTED